MRNMENYRENVLHLPDASLYYREYGEGSPLLMIHGVICDSAFFEYTAQYLAQKHRVITYDRRGYSRSSGKVGDDFWAEQAQDAISLLEKLCPNEQTIIVGCSAGAIIAMHVAARQPEMVAGLILHEPPLVQLLAPDHEAFAIAEKIKKLVSEGKYQRAINQFLLLTGESDERAPERREEAMQREANNMVYFIRWEFETTFSRGVLPDIPDNIPVAVCAGDAHRENYHYVVAHKYAVRCGYPVIHFPGVHNCARDLPLDFAVGVEGTISLPAMRKADIKRHEV